MKKDAFQQLIYDVLNNIPNFIHIEMISNYFANNEWYVAGLLYLNDFFNDPLEWNPG